MISYVKMCIIIVSPPFQQFQHLRRAVIPCILSNQEDSRSKWSNCGSKGSVPEVISTRILISIIHLFEFCE